MVLETKLKNEYSEYSVEERVGNMDMTNSAFINMKNNVRERERRESAIPEPDIEAVVSQIMNCPYLGSAKGALKLLNDKKGLISAVFYNDIKNHLKGYVEDELTERRIQSELEKNSRDRFTMPTIFESVKTQSPHDVWAIDFTSLKLLGINFSACVVYDIHTMSYLSLQVEITPTGILAVRAVEEALRKSGACPKQYILSDNGRQFDGDEFRKFLEENSIDNYRIPPGAPWNNGALESGNKDLKKVIYTIAGQLACGKNITVTKPGCPVERILDFVKACCRYARETINKLLPRMKFGVTPDTVLKRREETKRKENRQFAQIKKEERKQRMRKIKKGEIKTGRKTVEAKTWHIFLKMKSGISTDLLYVTKEVLWNRYAFITS